MAVVARGWSKTASTAVKLATAERIIGYQFNDVDRLYEALDQRKQPSLLPSGKERPRNSRLATVGDAHAKLRMAQQYYDNRDLVGVHWGLISATALSNNQMSEFGFRLGLDECGLPHMIEKEYDMATTVEAVFAAVEMDGAGQEQFHKVMARFGIQHRLVEPLQRRWIYKMVKSRLGLPDRFFIGHHFRLQEGIFETKLKRSTGSRFSGEHEEGEICEGQPRVGNRQASARENQQRFVKNFWKSVKWMWSGPTWKLRRPNYRLRRRVKRLWKSVQWMWSRPTWKLLRPNKRIRRRVKRLWRSVKWRWPGSPRRPNLIPSSLRAQGLPELRVARSSEVVKPLAKGPRPESTETITTPSKDVATSETKILGEESPGRFDDVRAVTPEQTMDRSDPVEKHKAAELLSSEISTPSQLPASQPQSVIAEEGTPEDVVATAENGSQDSNEASIDGPSPELSSKHGAASDAGPAVGHQPHEASGAESVEATEAGDTPEKFVQILTELNKKNKELTIGQAEMEQAFHRLRLAGQPKTPEQKQEFIEITSRRQQVRKLQLLWRDKLKQLEQLDKQS